MLVGIYLERSLDMVVSMLAIHKAGGAYLPLDPEYPTDRIEFMLEDAQASIILTQTTLANRLTQPGLKPIYLDRDWTKISTLGYENISGPSQPDHLAYVIYTSGSTGKPKGVQISHGALLNFLCSMAKTPGMADSDCLLAVTTLSFDIAALELLLPLTVGGQVEIASREMALDGYGLAECIEQSGITIMQATPATWRMLLETNWRGNSHLKILCGGEAMTGELASQLLDRCDELWNMYGPTETTVWSTCEQITADSDWISIGRPIANTQIYILDGQLQPVPVGVTGELYIGGMGLSSGYLNRPELTAEKFIDHPFIEGEMIYRTGDLARYRSDGRIEHLGRLDHQVKLRGFRIELGEIEAALSRDVHVSQSVVIIREDTPGDKRLVAYVVPASEPISTDLIRQNLSTHLPSYMVPSSFVVMDQLPLTPNGKMDRKALPVPDRSDFDISNVIAPRNTMESQLKDIWEEVLQLNPIGMRDNFFEIGGHSLLAVQLFEKVQQVTGQRLPLATLFQTPTIEQLADLLQQQSGPTTAKSLSPLVSIQTSGAKRPFFCVHGHMGNVLNFANLAHHLGP